jgi:hypothetical protein
VALPDNIRYLIEALRNSPPPAHTDIQSGPDAGTSRITHNPALGPIEQRRDGYRQYLNEFRAGSQEGTPKSYEEWIQEEQ